MQQHFLIKLIVLVSISFLFSACNKSNDQREFENRALAFPEGITEMTVEGKPVENRNDPEDWQVGPMFRGLIEIETPAYPNPVNLNTPLKIDLDVKGFSTIKGYEIFVFNDPAKIGSPILTSNDSSLPPGITTIILDPSQFSPFISGNQTPTLFRILIYDRQQNLISYGDVKVI